MGAKHIAMPRISYQLSIPHLLGNWFHFLNLTSFRVLDPSPCSSHGILEMLLPLQRKRECGPPGSRGQVSPEMVWPTDMSSLVDLDKGKLRQTKRAPKRGSQKNTPKKLFPVHKSIAPKSWAESIHDIKHMDSYAILSSLVSCRRLRRHQKSKGNTKGVQGNCYYNCTWIHKQGKSAAKCHRTFETTQITSRCVFYYQQGMMGLDFPPIPANLVWLKPYRLVWFDGVKWMKCIVSWSKESSAIRHHDITWHTKSFTSSICDQVAHAPRRVLNLPVWQCNMHRTEKLESWCLEFGRAEWQHSHGHGSSVASLSTQSSLPEPPQKYWDWPRCPWQWRRPCHGWKSLPWWYRWPRSRKPFDSQSTSHRCWHSS